MSLSQQEIGLIVERVRQEVEKRTGVKNTGCAGITVLVPSFVPSPEKALACITGQYGTDVELVFLSPILFKANGVQSRSVDWRTQPNELVDLLVNAKTVVLLAPGTGLLKSIGSGQEENGVAELLLRRILWGKPFDVVLDFTPPKFKRGTYYAQIAETIDSLGSMGVRFHAYQPAEELATDALSLVTEQDVADAKRNGCKTIACTKDAIVTPLAADAARELGIGIETV